MSDLAKARQTAFNILAQHGDCLRDDTVMDDLIEDIADALLGVAQDVRETLEALSLWVQGERQHYRVAGGMPAGGFDNMTPIEVALAKVESEIDRRAASLVPSTYQQSPALNWSLDRPECPRCKGQGRVGMIACNDCGATGSVVTSTNQGGGK